MSATNDWETALLSLQFTNTDTGQMGDATGLRGSSTAGVFYIAIHTADPGEAPASGQQTSEAAYTSYARVSVARDTAQWTVTGNTVDNDNVILFPTATGGSETETHVTIGKSSSGAGYVFFSGILTSNLPVVNGTPPQFAPGALDITCD